MTRYPPMFRALAARGEGAVVPFLMLGDPTPAESLSIVSGLVESGADGLELGIPFSDPIADGPVIQRAALRAREAGTTPDVCLALVAEIRRRFPSLPVGLLVYANLVVNHSIQEFYRRVGRAGADSVLVADVPLDEADPFITAARAAGVAPVLILPPDATPGLVRRIAAASQGYTYVLGRAGVTGHETRSPAPDPALLALLHAAGGAPAVIGFGVSWPDQVNEALDAGAAGVIVGSALVALIERHREDPAAGAAAMNDLLRSLKAAAQPASNRSRKTG